MAKSIIFKKIRSNGGKSSRYERSFFNLIWISLKSPRYKGSSCHSEFFGTLRTGLAKWSKKIIFFRDLWDSSRIRSKIECEIMLRCYSEPGEEESLQFAFLLCAEW